MTSMIGKRCGMLVVIDKASRPADYTGQIRGSWWKCRCDCGKIRIVPRQYLTCRTISSCGCAKNNRKLERTKRKKSPEEIREDKARAGRARATQLKGMVTKFRMGGRKPEITREDCKMLGSMSRQCKCAECGNVFERLSSDWVYKTTKRAGKTKWFCSYTCWRAEDKKPKRANGNTLAERVAEG